MSDGHTPLNGQDGLSYDFTEIPSKYDDPSPEPNQTEASTPEIFDVDRPNYDDYHPEDLNSDTFAAPTAPPREIGSAALHKSRSTSVEGLSNQFRPQEADGMPLPTKFDSSIVNLPPPGVIPDPSDVVPPVEAQSYGSIGATPTSERPLESPENSASRNRHNHPNNLANPVNPDNPENPEDPEDPEDPETSNNPENPTYLPNSQNSRPRQTRQSFLHQLNPLTTTSVNEDKFQGEKGRLGGRAKQELHDGQHALDHDDTEVAYRHFRNAMAGFVGEYADRKAQNFHAQMWKDHPQGDTPDSHPSEKVTKTQKTIDTHSQTEAAKP